MPNQRPGHREAAGMMVGLAGYNLVQNLLIPDRWYVPANFAATAGAVAYARSAGLGWDELGLGRAGLAAGLTVGGASAAACGGGVACLLAVRRLRPYLRDRRSDPSLVPLTAAAVLRFPLGTALFEEVMFRGVLTGLWRRVVGAARAEALSAAAFGLWHVIPTLRTLPGNPLGAAAAPRRRMGAVAVSVGVTALAGAGFGWLRERSGSVVAPWLAHAALNTAAFLAGAWAWRH